MGEKYTIQKKMEELQGVRIKKIDVYGEILFVFTESKMHAYRIKMG